MARRKPNIPKKVDRLKELEKIAEQLGIGQDREVKCVACKKTIKFKNAIVLTNKKKVTYLCKNCYEKLEKGELNKKEIGTDDILKQIEAIRKEAEKNIQPAPYEPKVIPWTPEPIKWEPKPIKWEPPYYTDEDKCTFKVFASKAIPEHTMLLKLEPDYAYNTNTITRK